MKLRHFYATDQKYFVFLGGLFSFFGWGRQALSNFFGKAGWH